MQTIPLSAKKILFSATIYDTNNNPMPNLSLAIQYFDTQSNKWELLTKSTTTNGALSASFDFTPSPSKATVLTSKINQIIAAGSMPAFRLITAVSLKLPVAELLATTTDIALDTEKTMFLANFGEMIYSPEVIKETLNAKETAILCSFPLIAYKLSMQNKDLAKELSAQTQRNTEIAAQLKKNTEVLQMREGEIRTLNANIVQEAQKTAELHARTADLNAKIALSDEKVAAQGKQILEKDEKIAAQKAEIATMQTAQKVVSLNTAQPINQVYSHVLNEVQTAATRDTNNRYSLSSVSMNLKTFVEQDANGNMKLQMIDAKNAEKINGATVSEVKLEVGTNNLPAAAAAGKIPNILGLTESAVRSVLQSIGLQLNPVYQATDTHTVGQAFKQTPKGGDAIMQNQAITVIFAKSTTDFN